MFKLFLSPGVRPSVRPSSVHNFFKRHLLNRLANFDETSQGCSFKFVQRNVFNAECWLPWQPKEKNHIYQNCKVYSLDIWCVSLCSRSLLWLFKLCPWGQNLRRPGGQLFFIEIYREPVNICFKRHLLLNRLANFDGTYDVPWLIPFQNCSKTWIPCRTLVAMITERKNIYWLKP